jgi:uncharacterized membrane protein HdeD (DUF308 family)
MPPKPVNARNGVNCIGFERYSALPFVSKEPNMSSSQQPVGSEPRGRPRGFIHDHWGIFLAEGIVLGLLGLAAILLPLVAGVVTTVFLGWLLLFAGVMGLFATFKTRQAPGFGWSLLSAVLAVFAGVALLWNPLQGLITLTFVLVAFFILDGIVMILLAISYRAKLPGNWQWLMMNGIVDLIIAGIIITGLPGTLIWALGLLIGVDMLFGGASLAVMAMTARKP